MKKDEKEKSIFEVRLKELSSLDKDITSLILKLIGLWFAILLILYKFNNLNEFTFIGLVTGLVSIIWVGQQYTNYVFDCYGWLSKVIRENKLLIESFPTMRWYEAFYYRKKY